jgi:ABC-type sugar transport system permease subunit
MRKSSLRRGVQLEFASLVIPGMIFFTIGVIVPTALGFIYSLTSWDGYTKKLPWVGLANYVKIFHDVNALNAWWFTIKFTVYNTIVQNILALLLALALDGSVRGKTIYRTIVFLPCLVAPVVAGYIWLRIYSDVLPALNAVLGTKINFRLFGSGSTVLAGLLIVNQWQWVGYWMLIYLAGLQSIPPELYEAARVDGASSLRRFFRITVPMLAPAFTICIVGITIGSLRVYDLMVSSTGGGPGRSSTSIIYHIYNTAIGGQQYGYGSAISMTLIFVLLLIAVVQLGALRRREIQL